MAIFEIQGPDGQTYEVDAPDENSAIQAFGSNMPQQDADPAGGYGTQVFSGLLEGATGALGAPVDLVNNLIVRPAASGINAVFGTDIQPSENPLGGSQGLREGLSIAPASPDAGPQMARRVSQSVGGAAVPLAGSGGTVAQTLMGLGSAAAGGVGGAVAQQVAPGNATAEIAAELLTGLGAGGVISGIANRSARNAAESAVPSIDDLKQQAGDLYRAAEARGVVADPTATTNLSSSITKIARDAELITPTGRVSTAYPKAKEALDLMNDYAGQPMNPTQMQVIRDTLSDAARTTEGKESRIATQMLKAFDEFSVPLAPELGQARDTASRYLKAQTLETARELAGSRAGQFTGSGFENALRTEYRGLERKIIKGQEKGWTPAQEEAISKVAQGTTTQNNLRTLGKLAPTGPVSFMAGGGVPFYVGNAVGGPAIGAAASAATMGTGFAARDLATRIGTRNADVAELLTRSGGQLPQVSNAELQRIIANALLGSNAAVEN